MKSFLEVDIALNNNFKFRDDPPEVLTKLSQLEVPVISTQGSLLLFTYGHNPSTSST